MKRRLGKKIRKELRKELKKDMKAIMDTKPKNGKEFSDQLKKYDIKPLWKINKKGDYYGVNFMKNDLVFKGSDIGKPYGINKLKASFEQNKQDLDLSNGRGLKK